MPLQIAFLGRGKLVVKKNNVGFAFNRGCRDFISLAFAGEKPRVGPGTATLDQADDFQPGGFRQALEFLGAFSVIRGVKIKRDKQRTFAARGTFKQGGVPSGYQASGMSSSLPCQLMARDGTTVEMACL